MGGLKAAQEFIEPVQHLLGQPFAYLVLEPPAVLEKGGQALRARKAQESSLAEEEAQSGRDRAARGLDHVCDAEVEPDRRGRDHQVGISDLGARCG